MNTIRKNSQGYGYKYSDLTEIHRYLEEVGERYFQEVEVIAGHDYIVTTCLDASGKEIRKCRGCRVPQATLAGKANEAQQYGSGLTYARRYSLLLAFGLATADDDGTSFTPVKPKATKTDRKPTDKPQCKVEAFDRQAGMDTIKRLLDEGVLNLLEIQNEVRKPFCR